MDSNTSFGPNSLAVDTSGKAHISYYDTTNPSIPALKYATNTSGSWVPETVDSSGPNVGFGASLAVDTSGNVHICYSDNTNGDLKYATNASGSWVPETAVDSGGYNFSLAVDTSGDVHISYYDYDNSAIKYVTKAMGSWGVPEIIATGVGKFSAGANSMALDKSGKVHVIYNEGSPNQDLKYVTNASGSWGVPETVDSNTTVGSPKSLALDTSGKAHISYYDTTNPSIPALKYATNALGFWTPMTVDIKVGYSSYSSSLGVDTLDNVHISYYDATNRALKYVSAAGTSGSWEMTTVDSSGDVGSSNSLALDTSGKVHIAYYDSANKDLKYATNAINKPTVKTRAATKVTDNSATLNGTVNAHNWTTRVWFQYGKKSGRYTKSSSKKTVYGSTDKKVGIGISGLTSQTEYYYRIVAKNRDGTTYGKQKSFITQ